MGPTASGKSAVALELAARLPLEIVSVDSAQVYRGMDIGTAKPDLAARSRVPHHLVDIIEPDQAYSAARFRTDALEAIAAIRSRGRAAAGGRWDDALLQGVARRSVATSRRRCTSSSATRRACRRRRLARSARRVGANRSRHRGTARAHGQPAHPACARGLRDHGSSTVDHAWHAQRRRYGPCDRFCAAAVGSGRPSPAHRAAFRRDAGGRPRRRTARTARAPRC